MVARVTLTGSMTDPRFWTGPRSPPRVGVVWTRSPDDGWEWGRRWVHDWKREMESLCLPLKILLHNDPVVPSVWGVSVRLPSVIRVREKHGGTKC